MKPTSFPSSRRFLQLQNASQPPSTADESTTTATAGTFNPTTPFDSSMALTILVLLTALFFMGFFSVYIRRFAAADLPPSPRRVLSPPTGNHKRGLDPAAVASLPLAAYDKAIKHPLINDCPICLGEFHDEETVKTIPYCGHVFHPRCLDTWLAGHVTCPLCRSAQLFKSVEEVGLDVVVERSATSTVRESDRCRVEGSVGVRRICSCTELANRTALPRSISF